jgi:hypothetical protein
MDERTCKKCLAARGKRWSSTTEADLQEGICPDISGEITVCRFTGKTIPRTGRIHIIGCGSPTTRKK